ncbi:28S ribosomal S29, mitochondrial [Olea europaea subsp. europaea]|uniref:Small ribosomal subunit protein mS29 n=1 Tax=Olea europaea subsp. europaea TaxID=158383 RepID=A0A8S0R380_OLEEU|nr:28S ribosomal S29, mitochondrial [Olea europaea subsp. europaea]
MLLRALRRATTTTAAASAAASSTLTKPPHFHLSTSRLFSANTTKANLTKAKKSKSKSDGKDRAEELQVTDTEFFVKQDEELRRRQLAEDENNPALDVGPNGRPLFTSTSSISLLSKKDACSYMKFSVEELNKVLPEGLPMGMVKEFEESSRSALLIRQSFLDLRDNFRRAVDPSLLVGSKGSKVRKQIVLDGPVSCGKSIALALLVHWAREEGWLVLYVPSGQEWTHGGFFYKNPQTGLWDTPVQAANILQDFSKYNESLLKKLKCNTLDPIPLGEGAGVGWPKGIDKMQISEDSTLYDLVQAGINNSHAAVGVLVRLRKELSDVKDIPVLIAIDQYNSWFTFSEYEEPVTVRSCRPVHARELATVNAFRSMLHENDMMVGAFSHSTAVGKLRQELPDVPTDARINFPRYNLDEAASVCHYYLRFAKLNL